MKLTSLEMLNAITSGDHDAVYAIICSHFGIEELDRIYIDAYPAIGISKYAILWQDGYCYSWNSSIGWESIRAMETPENELLIRS